MEKRLTCFVLCMGLISPLFGAALAETIRADNPFVDAAALKSQSSAFTVDGDGLISNGPLRKLGDPIDFSSLIKPKLLLLAFENSLFNCFEGWRYCEPSRFKWPTRDLNLKVQYEKGQMPAQRFDDLSAVMSETLGAVSFNVTAVSEIDDANLIFVVGTKLYLEEKLRRAADTYGLDRLKDIENSESLFHKLSTLFVPDSAQSFCYVSTRDRTDTNQVRLYFTQSGIEDCLPSSLFIAIGLNEISGDIPSVLDISKDHLGATFADALFVRLLYHEQFPVGGDIEQLRAFWKESFDDVFRGLLAESADNAPPLASSN